VRGLDLRARFRYSFVQRMFTFMLTRFARRTDLESRWILLASRVKTHDR